MNERKLIRACLDPHLLEEIPRFFGSFGSALGELFQNAHRAGASRVTVEYDEARRILAIEDNGCGIADPEVLLAAGRSGWKGNVVEPAGMGFFAHLAHVDRTVLAGGSGQDGWTLTLTPKVLCGEPAECRKGREGASRKGTRIELFLSGETLSHASAAETVPWLERQIRQARAYYPFTLIFRGAEIAPPGRSRGSIDVQTAVGRVTLDCVGRANNIVETGIWEYRPIRSAALRNAMEQAAAQYPKDGIAAGLLRSDWTWFIDPASGVRPKLPDRSELVADSNLSRACRQILGDVIAHIKKNIRLKASLPDKVGGYASEIHRKLTGGRLAFDVMERIWKGVMREMFPEFRWVSWNDPDCLSIWLDEDEALQVDTFEKSYFMRGARGASSSDLILTLNALGHPTACRADAGNPRVVITGLRRSEEAPHVSLAKSIHVEGIGSIPYLLNDPQETQPDKAYAFDEQERPIGVGERFIIAGDAQQAANTIRANPGRFTNLFFLAEHRDDHEGDYYRADPEGAEIADDEILAALMHEISAGYDPDRAAATELYFALQSERELTHGVVTSLAQRAREMKLTGLRETAPALRNLRTAETCARRAVLILKQKEDRARTRSVLGPEEEKKAA